MQSVAASRFPAEQMHELLRQLPFFDALLQSGSETVDCLLQHARILIANTGEAVVERGEFDSWFYFLLKGELGVHTEAGGTLVAYIRPGDMFGALAAIRDTERNATVVVTGSGGALLLGVDFAPFGELDDMSQIGLPAKLGFYRLVIDRTEAKLRAYDQEMPGTDLGERLQALPSPPPVSGNAGELHALAARADALADLLGEWNLTLENLPGYQPPRPPLHGDLLSDLERLYFPGR